MLIETGRVVAIEPDSLWVETLRKSACGKCSAKAGCGHGLMNTYAGGGKLHLVRVLLGDFRADDFNIHDDVDIALDENVLVSGAMLVYLLPLALMAIATVLGNRWGGSDAYAALGALLGLLAGFAVVRWRNSQLSDDCTVQPVVVGHCSSAELVKIS
jgi:sigma-E factor negative regulatory protein RseC